ncbi:MAG: hypothetical protein BWY76_02135 [bacterium ADurb.Bin429]|nr:MAG: hypothetical protein BWY76_02135 [bacterium ADurb.Bin429]
MQREIAELIHGDQVEDGGFEAVDAGVRQPTEFGAGRGLFLEGAEAPVGIRHHHAVA